MSLNQCVTGDTYVLTTKGLKMVCELLDGPFTAIVEGKEYDAPPFHPSGVKSIFKVTTIHPNGCHRWVKATANHNMLVRNSTETKFSWRQVEDLKPGDKMVLADSFQTIDVLSIVPDGLAEVFDCSVLLIHCFDANCCS